MSQSKISQRSFLLDTNIVSEFANSTPDERVLEWLNFHQDQSSYLSVISIGEIENGIALLPSSQKRQALDDWLQNEILVNYADFILPIETSTMQVWGHMMAELKRKGKPMPIMDSLIAATARQYNLILVTRNSSDFTHTNIEIVNPWVNNSDEQSE